jgi:dihydropteroate synthase
LLIKQGADILDIGGASSRPGASPVAIDDEINRVVPVITEIRKYSDIPISVDTTWADVAQASLESGADWINDISAGRFDPGILSVIAKHKAVFVVMHSRGTPQTMQQNPEYHNVVDEVITEIRNAVEKCCEAGIDLNKIVIDPGVGFGKTVEHNCSILKNCNLFCNLGFPVLLGTSRKSFLGQMTGKTVEERLAGSLGTVAAAYLKGVRLFRVHDVVETVDFLNVFSEVC